MPTDEDTESGFIALRDPGHEALVITLVPGSIRCRMLPGT